MKSRIVERSAGESEVSVVSEVNVTGIMAQFGRGLMQDVSDQMLKRFTEAMRAELEKPEAQAPSAAAATPPTPAAPAAPIEVVSFGTQIAGQAARRALRGPAVWIVAAVVIVMIYLVWFR